MFPHLQSHDTQRSALNGFLKGNVSHGLISGGQNVMADDTTDLRLPLSTSRTEGNNLSLAYSSGHGVKPVEWVRDAFGVLRVDQTLVDVRTRNNRIRSPRVGLEDRMDNILGSLVGQAFVGILQRKTGDFGFPGWKNTNNILYCFTTWVILVKHQDNLLPLLKPPKVLLKDISG